MSQCMRVFDILGRNNVTRTGKNVTGNVPQLRSFSSVDYVKAAYGSFFHSEALPNALPPKQNSPQHPPYGLYPELISGLFDIII